LAWSDYRVEREWQRYEGTPLRDLYRQLRERFLARHRPALPGRSLEIGPGPGRFTQQVGHPDDRVLLLELSRAMLGRIRNPSTSLESFRLDLVQGDAVLPPLRPRRFHSVVLLGNVLGFAEEQAVELLARMADLVAPGGELLLEFAPGPGERSKYMHRLPPGAVARLLAAPVRAVQPRVEREGFERIRPRSGGGRHFRRLKVSQVRSHLGDLGLDAQEILSVAPCLGNDPSRLTIARTVPLSWAHLLELEESVGRLPSRHDEAAAILLSAVRPPL
jgi:methyltransferase family protein